MTSVSTVHYIIDVCIQFLVEFIKSKNHILPSSSYWQSECETMRTSILALYVSSLAIIASLVHTTYNTILFRWFFVIMVFTAACSMRGQRVISGSYEVFLDTFLKKKNWAHYAPVGFFL